jgi:transposase-like protein
MARPKKLKPAAVRKIFKSTGSASTVAKEFGVSANLIYLIRGGRVHKQITGTMASPGRGQRRGVLPASVANIDVKRLADAIIDGLIARFRQRAGR